MSRTAEACDHSGGHFAAHCPKAGPSLAAVEKGLCPTVTQSEQLAGSSLCASLWECLGSGVGARTFKRATGDAGWGQWSERPSTTTSWSWDERPTSWSWGGCGPARASESWLEPIVISADRDPPRGITLGVFGRAQVSQLRAVLPQRWSLLHPSNIQRVAV